MPKISIIVPVYSVEKYLSKCIDSILNQTFKDFELILVDDGSPDNSGKICDEYALKDSRVKVIHKENGGQSSARNVGLDIAQGEYVGFVDSDDWIEPDMYEILYRLIIENETDISIIGINFIYDNRIRKSMNYDLKVFNKSEAMKELIQHIYFGNYFCSKLFKKELFNELKFKEGVIYEDIDLMYKLVNNSSKVVALGVNKYNYLQRAGSTVRKQDKNFNEYFVKIERLKFIKEYYPEIISVAEKDLYEVASRSLFLLVDINKNFINTMEFKEIKNYLNKNFKYLNSQKTLHVKSKILIIALRINERLFYSMIKGIKWIKKRKNQR